MKRKVTILYPSERTFTFTVPNAGNDANLLEQIFAGFNAGSGDECDVFLASRARSLSVNDLVCIDTQWYLCESCGWSKVTDDFVRVLCDEVQEHALFAAHGAWFALNDVMFKRKQAALRPNAVELHPATDAWMSGDRYGAIVARWADNTLLVRLDKSQRLVKATPADIIKQFSRV
jgi:hypothetical protein